MVRRKPQTITEQQFTNSVLEWAKVYGWLRFHVRQSGEGGRNVQGDRGFPDLVLLKPPRLIFAELKVGRNKESAEQVQWLGWLLNLGCPEIAAYTWRPAQWSEILAILGSP